MDVNYFFAMLLYLLIEDHAPSSTSNIHAEKHEHTQNTCQPKMVWPISTGLAGPTQHLTAYASLALLVRLSFAIYGTEEKTFWSDII